jgi:DNA-binding MarR family transcriptional regulator/N-acetylglutamate synthase-like GNAT family acetyltransferase
MAIQNQALERSIDAVRRFNRFYTRKIGVLREGLYESPFSLAETRVLYELANRNEATAVELGKELGLDAGYLSRILRGFSRAGLIQKTASPSDGRQVLLSITPRGRKVFAPLNQRSRDEIADLIKDLSDTDRAALIDSLSAIETLLGKPRESSYILRPPQPGDMGWVVNRHGAFYAQEYGYDWHFEALVAGIVSQFVENFDPKCERCWIAEKDGRNVGSVFVVRKSKTVAQLRMLIVDPSARGLGIGKRLVSECVRFAKQVGYKKMTLWTHSQLHAARGIYEGAGFRLVHKERHHSFGLDLTDEIWDLKL